MRKISVFILMFTVLISCEKDDICPADTPTTPRLFIEFYNNDAQENLKNVTSFRVQGVDNENVLDGYNIVTTNNVLLPLKTNEGVTQYKFHKSYFVNDNDTPDNPDDDIITGNEDIITITYDTEEIYVSRACGFKTIFSNIDVIIEDDGDNWMLSRLPTTNNQTILDETTVHYQIFH